MPLPIGLPRALPSPLAQLGAEAACADRVCRARWSLRLRGAAKHHSPLGREILRADQDRARGAIRRAVTSREGGGLPMALHRAMDFGSSQAAWSWLHMIGMAMGGRSGRP